MYPFIEKMDFTRDFHQHYEDQNWYLKYAIRLVMKSDFLDAIFK
jgi:hypothetical protein